MLTFCNVRAFFAGFESLRYAVGTLVDGPRSKIYSNPESFNIQGVGAKSQQRVNNSFSLFYIWIRSTLSIEWWVQDSTNVRIDYFFYVHLKPS